MRLASFDKNRGKYKIVIGVPFLAMAKVWRSIFAEMKTTDFLKD
jgi:hypothetical protein